MVKISVIIPIYNAEPYLKECLDSIVNQTFKEIEIICINDGSTDNSLKILEEYSKYDNRFIIKSIPNQGQGNARNLAMTIMNGEYFFFMDADDKLELDALEKCYNVSKDKSLDFVMFKLINYDEVTKELYKTPLYDMQDITNNVKNNVFSIEDLEEDIFKISVTPVNKLYSTRFIKELGINFPTDVIFEDNIFFWNMIFNAKRAYFIPEYFYIRRRHNQSTTGESSEKWCDSITVYNRVWGIFKKYGQFDRFKHRLYSNKINFTLSRFENLNEEFKELFFENWQNDLINIIKTEYDFMKVLCDADRNIAKYVLCAENYKEFELSRTILRIISELNMKTQKLNSEINEIQYQEIISENQINQLEIRLNSLNKDNIHLQKKVNEFKLKDNSLHIRVNELKLKNNILHIRVNELKLKMNNPQYNC